MNYVVLIGRLTRDPELRYTPNGAAVANFTLAVDRNFTNQAGEKETDFIPVVVWKKMAENCANYLRKGRLCAVEGRLQIRQYTDKDGQKRRITEIVAGTVRFLDYGNKDQGRKIQQSTECEEIKDINLDDLPF